MVIFDFRHPLLPSEILILVRSLTRSRADNVSAEPSLQAARLLDLTLNCPPGVFFSGQSVKNFLTHVG